MSSKSKDVRIEQHRILEKKLDLRLQQLAQKGISKEKAQSDPLVKQLKAKIRETNVRIKVVDKFAKLEQDLAEAKVQKALKKDETTPEAEESAPKQKKKAVADVSVEHKKKSGSPEKEQKQKKKTN